MYDREHFYHELLDALDAPKSEANLAALRAWGECEGSEAAFNPLDTTLHMQGATEYNTFGDNQHVWNYPDEETGVRATVQTLHNGYYPHIMSALKSGDGRIVSGAARDDMRTWGTNADCIASKLATPDAEPTDSPGHTAAQPLSHGQRDDIRRVARVLLTRTHRLTRDDRELIDRLRTAARHADGVK